MTTENYNTKQKQVYFKAYQELVQLEHALKHIKGEDSFNFQISILGKVGQFYHDKNKVDSNDTDTIKKYWKLLMGDTTNFGSFYNPQIESVFIVGNLVSTFLHEINGKTLATLSSGPHSIVRGIGATEIQANNYLKLLGLGNYILIVRGFEDELQKLKTMLAK